ncbi:protein downstream neighbor of Son [Arapaima gigas]
MSHADSYSPNFKRPADTLRSRTRRTRDPTRSAASLPRPESPGAQTRSTAVGTATAGGGLKRRNPFANISTSERPKRRAGSPWEGAPCPVNGSQLHELLHRHGAPESVSSAAETWPDGLHSTGEEEQHTVLSVSVVSAPPTVCRRYPPDWSLKTRLLITSPLTFSWAEQLRAQEEAQGVAQHCRMTHTHPPAEIQDPRSCSELRCAFHRCLCYWQHPSLPWLPLFPRIGADRNFSGKSAPWRQDEAVQQSLMAEWSLSVTSLYSLLRAHLCPFFYLCSYQFTALFRATGMSGTRAITALLSPTTVGLRDALRAEGEFVLCVSVRRAAGHLLRLVCSLLRWLCCSRVQEEEAGDNDDNDEDAADEEDTLSWLEEMGVQDKIKRPDRISVKLCKERSELRVDRRPESVVLVEGSSTFTLLNFLINCKGLVAASGPQAGLPPTLLAPVAFRGATLHTLKARSISAKTRVQGNYENMCSLEITGPVMPHALHTLTQLLSPAQRGCFSMGLYSHEPTLALNTRILPPTTPPQQDAAAVPWGPEGCGLLSSTIEHLAEPAVLGKAALRHLHMEGFSYTWSM